MKYIIITIFTTIFLGGCIIAQTNTDLPLNTNINAARTNSDPAIITTIETTIDLTQVVDDKVPVTINPGKFSQDTVTYRLPKVVQGTYKVSNFGSFVESFKAYDYKGEEMEFNKIDINSWVIPNATELDKIAYLVNDTFDIEADGTIPTPFSPSGTNISIENYVIIL